MAYARFFLLAKNTSIWRAKRACISISYARQPNPTSSDVCPFWRTRRKTQKKIEQEKSPFGRQRRRTHKLYQSQQEAIVTACGAALAQHGNQQDRDGGMNMCGSFYKRGNFAWVQDVRGNFVCIYKGELAATVFSTQWEPWQVLIHFPDGTTSILRNESFQDPQVAMSRAEASLDGTSGGGMLHRLNPRGFANAFLN
jgi:hypothetical protein